jgi:hypothetical protein
MSEPCAHEREFAGTQRDTLTSFVNTGRALVKVTAERDTALAALARVRAVADMWAGFGDKEGFRTLKEFGVADIRAALEGKAPQ